MGRHGIDFVWVHLQIDVQRPEIKAMVDQNAVEDLIKYTVLPTPLGRCGRVGVCMVGLRMLTAH